MKGGGGSTYRRYTEPISRKPSKGVGGDGCDSIIFTTEVHKFPVDLLTYDLGYVLDVELGPLTRAIEIKDGGTTLGNLIPVDSQKLISCMEKGVKFQAVIIEITGSSCIVRVMTKR